MTAFKSYWLPITILFFAFFYNLGGYPLLDNNEGLYATIALGMVQSGEWILPKLNGVLYLEKPPLLYWLTAFSFKLFGVNEVAARLVPAVSGFALCVYMMWFVNRVTESGRNGGRYSEFGEIAALLFGSSILLVIIGRTVYFDMLFCVLFTISVTNFYIYLEASQDKSVYSVYNGFIFLALATITKGLMAPVLAGLIILIYGVIARAPQKKLIGLLYHRGVLLYLLVAAPWHIAAYWQHNDFAWAYFVNEHWNRFLNQRIPADYYTGPFYYYLPRIMGYMIPWTGTVVFLIKTYRSQKITSQEKGLRLFSTVWFLVLLIFFSLSQAKANYYMVLGMPAVMTLIAMGITKSVTRRSLLLLKIILLPFGLLFATMALVLSLNLSIFDEVSLRSFGDELVTKGGVQLAISLSFCVFIGLMIVVLAAKRHLTVVRSTSMLAVITLCVATHVAPFDSLVDLYSSKRAIDSLPIDAVKSEQVYLYKDYEFISAVTFYAQHEIPVIQSTSADLWYGQRLGKRPDLFPSFEDLAEKRATNDTEIFILARPSFEPVLKNKGFCLKQDFIKRAVFTNRCP